VPPAYSAVKFQGQALYKSARKGREQEIDREALRRPIEVYSLTLDDFSRGLAAFTVHCSKGTYVRVLAQTLMEKVGTCGTVVKLTRTACAGLTLAECVSLAQIEAALANGSLSEQQFIIPIPKLALGLAQLQAANSSSETRLLAGQELIYSQQNFIGNKFESWDNSKLSAGGMSNDVLLLDCAGTALGLGKITYLAADRITVRMKRSLL
jgi:tRNA pseudouridine55 synthase